ncbi:MAG: alpha-ketoglutarate-dependent dioxygenase AlkB [Gammaproteobacteria bacterium]
MALGTQYENILPQDGEVYFVPAFLDEVEAESYFHRLSMEINWRQRPVVVFGRTVMQPRMTAWYADSGVSIHYSGLTELPKPWTPTLLTLKTMAEAWSGCSFNGVLLNLYRNGEDALGWHSDDEAYLGVSPVIVSLSFGATRTCRFRHRLRQCHPVGVELTSGSLLLMRGQTQRYWHHCVPKRKRVHAARINLTFRWVHTNTNTTQ